MNMSVHGNETDNEHARPEMLEGNGTDRSEARDGGERGGERGGGRGGGKGGGCRAGDQPPTDIVADCSMTDGGQGEGVLIRGTQLAIFHNVDIPWWRE